MESAIDVNIRRVAAGRSTMTFANVNEEALPFQKTGSIFHIIEIRKAMLLKIIIKGSAIMALSHDVKGLS